jgi:hypothetical protein
MPCRYDCLFFVVNLQGLSVLPYRQSVGVVCYSTHELLLLYALGTPGHGDGCRIAISHVFTECDSCVHQLSQCDATHALFPIGMRGYAPSDCHARLQSMIKHTEYIIFAGPAQVLLENSSFTSNTAQGDFGAVFMRGISEQSPLRMSMQATGSIFVNNSAGLVAALYASASNVTLVWIVK